MQTFGSEILAFSKRIRINYRQPRNVFEITRVAGNQLETVNKCSSRNNCVRQFDPILLSQFNCLNCNGFTEFQNIGIIHKISQYLVSNGQGIIAHSILVITETFGTALTTPFIKVMPLGISLPER